MKLLLVEDEKSLNRIIAKRLRMEGYAIDCAYDGEEGLAYAKAAAYDVMLVDVMLPHLDGFALVRQLRSAGNITPVLFLTARDATADKIEGLDSGGDDYLVKPFVFDELLARLRSLIRRHNTVPSNELSLDSLNLNIKTHAVSRDGVAIDLTAKEYNILEYLLQNAGAVLTRAQIQEHVWDFSYEGASNMIDVYINSLRKKIDKEHAKKLLHTVRGVGYVLKTK